MAGIPSCAAGVPIFQMLPAEVLDQLGRAMQHRRFARGEVVIPAGELVQQLIVVARGRLKLAHTSRGGREQVVRTLGPGEFVGEMALFAPLRQAGDLIAQEETEACLVQRAAVQAILREHPQAALRLTEILAQRLADAEQLIADLGVRDVGQRLAAELLRLGEGASPGSRLRIPVSWADLAGRLGTTPESLSRRLKALLAQGIISQEGARMVILLDPERLRRLAEG